MHDDPFTQGLPPRDDPKDSSPLAIYAMIGGLCFAALSFVVFGIGYALGEWGGIESGEAEEPTAEAVAPEASPEPDPKTDPESGAAEAGEDKPALLGAEATPTLEANAAPTDFEPVDGPLPGSEPVPEYIPPGFNGGGGGQGGSAAASSGGDGATGAASGGDPNKVARVSVTLVLKHYTHVDVKLGGKVFRLDGDKTVKIRPGGYRVELRKSPEDPWKSAGLIEVGLGNKYRVILLDPPLVKLETL